MTSFCLDGSALAKRYVPETGSVLVDFILDNVPEPRLYILNIGFAEVVSVLVAEERQGDAGFLISHYRPAEAHAFGAQTPHGPVDPRLRPPGRRLR